MWYAEWFSSSYYLSLYKHRDDADARHLINLIQRNVHLFIDAKALDICCGAGRHSIELARRGFNVTGFDLSRHLISSARWSLKRSPEKDLRVKFLIKDMRHFDFNERFDLAVNLFTSFGYFDNDEENFRVFHNAYSSLKKKGYFVFDFLNEKYLKENIIPVSRNKLDDKVVIQKRSIDDGFVTKEIHIKDEKKEKLYKEILRLYTPKEIIEMMNEAGFEILHKYGDYFGSTFNSLKSKRLVIIAQKT